MSDNTTAALRKEIAIGIAEADRGEFIEGEQAFAEIRQRSAKRKEAPLRQSQDQS